MTDKFKTLLTIELLHSYYTNGKCTDLSVEPVSGTREMLDGHKLICRYAGNMSTILFNADGNNPVIEIDGNTIFTFALRVKNSLFMGITQGLPVRGRVNLYTNTTNTAGADGKRELDKEEAILCGNIIGYTLASNSKTTITLEDANGNKLDEKTYPAGSKDEQHRFDTSSYGTGLYKVIADDGASANEYWYYSDANLAASNVAGIIRITNHAASPFGYNGNEKYKISFTPVSSKWSYYVVAENLTNAEFATLAVTDQGHGATDDNRAQILFTQVKPIPASNKVPGYLTTNTGKVALFESTAAVPVREKPRKQIKLMKNGSSLIGNLPNPSPGAANGEMYVYL